MASRPNYFQKWLYSEEAKKGWEDIYRHLCGFWRQTEQEDGIIDHENESAATPEPKKRRLRAPRDYENDEPSDQTDSAVAAKALSAAIVNSSVSWSVHCMPCKFKRPSKDADNCFTIIRYKNLTIKIFGKITLGNNLAALVIHEVSLNFVN